MKLTVKYKKVYAFFFVLALAGAVGLFRVLTVLGLPDLFDYLEMGIQGILLAMVSFGFVVVLADKCCSSVLAKAAVLAGFGLRVLVDWMNSTQAVINHIVLWGAHQDEEAFFNHAFMSYLQNNPNISWTAYTGFLQRYFDFVGANWFNTAMVNVFTYTVAIFFLYLIAKEFDVNQRYIDISISVFMLFPISVLLSSYIMRESLCSLYILVTIYVFVKWMKTNNYVWLAGIALTYLPFHHWIHEGYIGLILGIGVVYALWIPRKQKFGWNFKILLGCAGVLGFMFVFAFTQFFQTHFKYLASVDINNLLQIFNRKYVIEGGSEYLTWMNVTSFWQVIPYSIIKMIYFQFSPIIFDMRAKDLAAVAIDVVPYTIIIVATIANILSTSKANRKGKLNYLSAVLVIYLGITFVFAWGTRNAGTAMRHRSTLLSLLLIMYMLSTKVREKTCDIRS